MDSHDMVAAAMVALMMFAILATATPTPFERRRESRRPTTTRKSGSLPNQRPRTGHGVNKYGELE